MKHSSRPPRGAGRSRPSSSSRAQATRAGGFSPHMRPERDKARWVVGIHSCEETLKVRPKKVRELWLRDDLASNAALRQIAETAERFRTPVRMKSLAQLDAVGSGHQGVALAVEESPEWLAQDLKSIEKCLVIILDGIEDPHNLGSILRTAWLVGADAIIIPADRAVGVTPAVCKVASGGAEHVPVETRASLTAEINDLQDAGFWIYGLSEKGKSRPWDLKLPQKVAWVIGSENTGLRITTERACDDLVRIPQATTGSSYNAAIAAAMALAETVRQLGKPE